jgi:hypothetical protein
MEDPRNTQSTPLLENPPDLESRGTIPEEDWPFMLTLLPPDLEASAREHGALLRKRGVPSADALLRLSLAYGYSGLSLRGTALWARQAGVADLSDVALLKRLRQAVPWLRHLLTQQLAQRAPLRAVSPESETPLRLRLIDASTVSRRGSRGADFRLHLLWDLRRQEMAALDLTPAAGAHTGESLERFPYQPGDLLVADRGYGHRPGIAAVQQAGALLVVRFSEQTLPLEDRDGQPFDLLAALRSLGPTQVGDFPVQTAPQEKGKQLLTPALAGRVVALRKSPQAAEAARRQVREQARKRGRTPAARTLEAADYVFLFTTLPDTVPATTVLEVYRFRWQIELAFKRLKSLLRLDELLAQDEHLCQAFLLAKLLAALLVEDLTHRYAAFSPWGYGPPDRDPRLPPPVPLAAPTSAGGDAAPRDRGRALSPRLGRGSPTASPGVLGQSAKTAPSGRAESFSDC